MSMWSLLLPDTDSVFVAVADTDLSKLVREEYKERWPEIVRYLFEDPDATQQQAGLFKVRLGLQQQRQ
jgi:hypothetical protein